MARKFFAAATVCVVGVVYAVHYQQTKEKKDMHKGVLRDLERQNARAAEISGNGKSATTHVKSDQK